MMSQPALYAVPLCTYISAWLIQVSGHVGLIPVGHTEQSSGGFGRCGGVKLFFKSKVKPRLA